MANLERFTHRLRGLPDEEDEFEPSDEGDAEATFVDAFVPLIKNCHRIFISNESDWLSIKLSESYRPIATEKRPRRRRRCAYFESAKLTRGQI